jgi:hypothetical protein
LQAVAAAQEWSERMEQVSENPDPLFAENVWLDDKLTQLKEDIIFKVITQSGLDPVNTLNRDPEEIEKIMNEVKEVLEDLIPKEKELFHKLTKSIFQDLSQGQGQGQGQGRGSASGFSRPPVPR